MKSQLVDHAQHIQAEEITQGVRSGTGEVNISEVRLLRQGVETRQVLEGEALTLEIDLVINQDLPDLTVGIVAARPTWK